MKNETIVKSIIYGNSCSNNYGIFRALCAAITEKEHIDKIIFYLRAADNFRKYNKYVYAFRLEESKTTFVTETGKNKTYIQGFNEDTTLEGNGEKLLHLLQKFNVRNVLVIVAISQKDPLSEFNAEHYRTVVKAAKDLLKSLYDRVLKAEDKEEEPIIIQKQPIARKLYVLPQLYKPSRFTEEQRRMDNNRPNYVGLQFKRENRINRKVLKKATQIRYLDNKIKQLAYSLQNLIQQFGQRENTIIKFAIQYEKTPVTLKIIKALCLLLNCQDKYDLVQEDIASQLKLITSSNIHSRVISELNIMVLGDKNLTQLRADEESKAIGMLFKFLTILLKSYSYAKQIAILEAEDESRETSVRISSKKETRSIHSSDEDSRLEKTQQL